MAMGMLVLGGTSWLGGEVARTALARGHDVTCLARGRSGTPPDGVTWVRADRDQQGAYDGVRGVTWDAVVDVSWQPGLVRSALAALADQAAHWSYVSTCSVYGADDTPGADESAPLLPAYAGERAQVEAYGEAKVACERACHDALGDRLLVARAGLIGGPGDRSDRFGYWPGRFALVAAEASGGAGARAVLVPDAAAQSTQTIDVRDLAGWLVSCAGVNVTGTFNAVGEQVPLGEVLAAARAAAGHDGPVVTAEAQWLLDHDVAPWMGPQSLPLWLPGDEYVGHAARSDRAAVAAGLSRRPLAEMVAGSLGWERERGLDRERRAGLTRTRERELLAALTS